VAAEVLAHFDEPDVADLVAKLLLIRNNIRHAAGKRGAANGAPARWHQEQP
jgi:hypothetical protein